MLDRAFDSYFQIQESWHIYCTHASTYYVVEENVNENDIKK